MLKMIDEIFTPRRESVDYCVRYMEQVFHALLEDRHEPWVLEKVNKFHDFIDSHEDPY